MAKKWITPIGTLSYPSLFTPRANPAQPDAPPKFSCMIVWTPEHQAADPNGFQLMKAAIKHAIAEKWPNNPPSVLRYPVRKVEDSESMSDQWPGGTLFCNFSSKNPPGVVRPNHEHAITDSSEVYAGQDARVSFGPFGYDVNGNRGVSFGLNNVQITRMNAERIDGRRRAQDEFESVVDHSQTAEAAGAGTEVDDDDSGLPF